MSGPASEWAAGQQAGTPLRWKEFEAAAYADHPKVREAVSGNYRVTPLAASAMLAGVAILLAPIVGLTLTFVGWLRSEFGPHADPSALLHAGGLLFVLAAVFQVLVLVTMRRTGDREFDQWAGWVGISMGVLTLLFTLPVREQVPNWLLYAIPVAVTVVLAVVVVLAAVGAEPAERTQGPARGPARAAVAKLSEAERDAVRADLEAALDDLLARTVISSREREKVRDAPLGMLTVALSASRKRKSA